MGSWFIENPMINAAPKGIGTSEADIVVSRISKLSHAVRTSFVLADTAVEALQERAAAVEVPVVPVLQEDHRSRG